MGALLAYLELHLSLLLPANGGGGDGHLARLFEDDLPARTLIAAANARTFSATIGHDHTASDCDITAFTLAVAADARVVILDVADGQFAHDVARALGIDGQTIVSTDVDAALYGEPRAVAEDQVRVAADRDAVLDSNNAKARV